MVGGRSNLRCSRLMGSDIPFSPYPCNSINLIHFHHCAGPLPTFSPNPEHSHGKPLKIYLWKLNLFGNSIRVLFSRSSLDFLIIFCFYCVREALDGGKNPAKEIIGFNQSFGKFH